jgi:lysophospholipase L1-like esterase
MVIVMAKANYSTGGTVTAPDMNTLGAEINEATRLLRYDQATNWFNLKASNTRRLHFGLARARANSGLCQVVAVGDSETDGYNGVTGARLQSWPEILRATWAAQLGLTVAGEGVVPIASAGGMGLDPRWSTSGSWSNNNQYRATSSNTATATFTSTQKGRYVDVVYFGTSSPFTVNVDGAGPVTVTPGAGSGVANEDKHYIVDLGSGAAGSTHTVVLTATGAGNVYILGCNVYNATGLMVHNLGMFGAQSGHWSDLSSFVGTGSSRLGMLPPASVTTTGSNLRSNTTPDAVYCALGVNDIVGEIATAVSVSNLMAIRNMFPNSDFFLIVQYPPSTSPNWAAFVSASYTLASFLDVPLLDLTDQSGGYANISSKYADGLHPNTELMAATAFAVARSHS